MPSRRDAIAATGSALLLGLAGCRRIEADVFSPGTDADSDWPMPQYDPGNTAFAPQLGVTERWRTDAGFGVRTPAPSTAPRSSRRPRPWSHPISSGGIQGLAVGDGALFVACEAGEENGASLYCLEPA